MVLCVGRYRTILVWTYTDTHMWTDWKQWVLLIKSFQYQTLVLLEISIHLFLSVLATTTDQVPTNFIDFKFTSDPTRVLIRIKKINLCLINGHTNSLVWICNASMPYIVHWVGVHQFHLDTNPFNKYVNPWYNCISWFCRPNYLEVTVYVAIVIQDKWIWFSLLLNLSAPCICPWVEKETKHKWSCVGEKWNTDGMTL